MDILRFNGTVLRVSTLHLNLIAARLIDTSSETWWYIYKRSKWLLVISPALDIIIYKTVCSEFKLSSYNVVPFRDMDILKILVRHIRYFNKG